VLNSGQLIALFIRLVNVLLNTSLQFALAAFLSKEYFASLAISKSLFQSFDFAHLGVRNALDRLLPVIGYPFKAKVFYTSVIITLTAGSVLATFWICLGYHTLLDILFISAGLLYSVVNLYKVYHRSVFDFRRFNILSFFNDNVVVLAQLGGLFLWGYMGVGYSVLISYAVIVFFLFGKGKLKIFSFIFKHFESFKRTVRLLFKFGFVLFLNSVLTFVVMIGDKLMVGNFYTKPVVADYVFVLMFQALMIMIPSTLIEVQISRLMANRNPWYYLKYCLLIQAVLIIGLLALYFLYPYVAERFFSSYSHLRPMVIIAGFGALLSAPAQIFSVFYQAIDRRAIIFRSNLGAVIAYAIFFLAFCIKGMSIDYLIWAKNIYYGLFFIVLLASFSKKMIPDNR
jgi:O-antigen/teichoic acid export membrane protein